MDLEAEQNTFSPSAPFQDKSIRMAFVRKVYTILSVQLVISFGIMLIFSLNESCKQYCIAHFWTGLIIILCSYIPICALSCDPTVGRIFPINVIIMTVIAIMMGCALGFVGAAYQTSVLVMIIGITALVVIALTVFACQTKIDFTPFSGGMIAILLTLIAIGIIAAVTGFHWLIMLYAGLGTIVFSVYIVIDTQIIMGGRKLEINPEDYIFAVLMLYLDIINLFLMLIQLLGNSR